MNPRELLARLNVPVIRYQLGRGGIPELTNIDIAGALGMIQDPFARDVFQTVWWADGARFAETELAQTVLRMVMTEHGNRQKALVAARLELNIAQCGLEVKRRPTDIDRQIIRDCEMAVSQANHRAWPWSPQVYARLYSATISELRSPRHCPVCHGRGEVFRGDLKITCVQCGGTGTKHEKLKHRASLLDVDYKLYRKTWCKVYDWTFGLVRDAEIRGARDFARAVADECPQAA